MEVCLSFKLTWINALLTTATTLVLAIISQYCFDVGEPASPLGYYLLFSLPWFAIAAICLLLIQFLNFERSKWLLPMSVVVIAALFTFMFPISLFTNEGVCSFAAALSGGSASCFNWKDYCNLKKFNSTPPDLSSPEVSRHGIDLSFYDTASIAAAVIVVAFVIACCCTCVCHQCYRESYESNCFPMINKIMYDTSNP